MGCNSSREDALVEARAGAARELQAQLAERDARDVERDARIVQLEKENVRIIALEEELERLRAQTKEAQPSPVKLQWPWATSPAKLSAADAAAVRAIEEQAKREDAGALCCFECLDKRQLMDLPEDALLPKYQDLKRDRPSMFVPFTISFSEACAGVHVKSTLTISHRWMSRLVADVDGTQLAAIKKHLAEHGEGIERVWVDYSCMPQGEKTPAQSADFKRMISQVNLPDYGKAAG